MADKPLGCLVCLLGILSLLLPSSSLQCSDKCWFVYHPSDSRSSTQDFVVQVSSNKKITGIITIDKDVLWDNIGNDEVPRVIFRLMKTDLEQPLVVAIDDRPQHDTQLVIWGEIDGVINGELEFGRQHRISLHPNSNVRIQITDRNITSEQSYQIYVNGQHLSYNYLSAKKWGRFKNTRLNTTTKIKDTDAFNLTRYNFISVCSDPKPVLCDDEEILTINAVLGAEYTLSCSGSGAPYLSSRWDKETYRPTFEKHEEVIDTTTADNFIRSTLKISAFTVDHIGTWTCTISNLNFSESVQKMYEFHYSHPVSLMTRPSNLETYDKCWFVYHPSDSRSSTQDFVVPVPPDKKITGIITIDGEFKSWENSSMVMRDTLRFSKNNRDDCLVLAIDAVFKTDRNQLSAWGEANIPGLGKDIYGAQHFDRLPYKFKIFQDLMINIQLTDINITTDEFYSFYVGVPGSSEYWQYNYESENMWGKFSDLRVDTTTKIKDTDPYNLTRYNFISVCSDPKPVLYDDEEIVTINAVLGAEYTLSCSGSGAPYLSSRWNKETYRPTFETHEEVIDTTTADNFIQTTLKIGSFTVDHIGTWTCTISNLNFQETVQKTYEFHYSEPIILLSRPSLGTYDPSAGNTSLEWKVEGWPLDHIRLECDIRSVGTHEIHRDTRQFYTRHPPRLAITLVLTSVATQDLVNCRLRDTDVPLELDSTVISKVGYNCRTGQYGEGRSCLNCPRGETSLPASTECFPVNNACSQDQFGEDDDCTICPWGSVTFPKDMAAKEQDCRDVRSLSQCATGAYGYGSSSECQVCPREMTSLKGAVKSYDCVRVSSFCRKAGYWGEKHNCQPCPGNHTSDIDAVKIQDCYPVKSYCSTGYFGIDTNCIPCPDGMTSHSYTVSAKGCFEQSLSNLDEIKKEERSDFYMIAFYAVAVIALAASVIASLVIYKRYRGRCATLMSYLFTTSTLSSSAEREHLRSMPELIQMHLEIKDTVVEVPGNPILESGSAVAEPKAEGEGDGSGILFFKENRTGLVDRRSPSTV